MMKMMKKLEYRKIQRVGKGSFILTLPREWVKEAGLDKGDHIAVIVQDDQSLLLIPRKILDKKEREERTQREFRIHVGAESDIESVCRMIRSLYVVSADIIHICFKSKVPPEYKTAIRHLSKNLLLGSEIIRETDNEITLQILIDHPDFPVDQAIRRMAILALSANKEAISALRKCDRHTIEIISETCNDVERLNLYVIRQLKYYLERKDPEALGFKSPKEFLGYRIIANVIKEIADNALNIANNIQTVQNMIEDQMLLLNRSLDEELYMQILEFNSKAHRFFEEALNVLFRRDYEGADRLISQYQATTRLENDIVIMLSSKKLDPNISAILRLIINNSRKIIEGGRNIAEITLNRTVEEKVDWTILS
ncbi:hypothetical protein DRO37_03030 [Candidatus Bathyarchaeota archaeon]|nr:MAG: hypothetical protein DRO37_03030 [Candidatus Bathyarchaeota archaeon]